MSRPNRLVCIKLLSFSVRGLAGLASAAPEICGWHEGLPKSEMQHDNGKDMLERTLTKLGRIRVDKKPGRNTGTVQESHFKNKLKSKDYQTVWKKWEGRDFGNDSIDVGVPCLGNCLLDAQQQKFGDYQQSLGCLLASLCNGCFFAIIFVASFFGRPAVTKLHCNWDS